MGTYRERRLARAERLRGFAEKREAASDALHADARAQTEMIPFGQPILVGHHSEKRHRAAVDRGWAKMGAAVENDRKADSMASRAASIEAQAAAAIYSDDPDAIERLTEKIAGMEAQREEMKAANAAYRKAHRAELKALSAYERGQAVPFPSYSITNLTGNIGRCRDRLVALQREREHGPRDRMICARFESECAACGARLEKGVMIRYNRQQGARCAVCPDQGGN